MVSYDLLQALLEVVDVEWLKCFWIGFKFYPNAEVNLGKFVSFSLE